jgi:hypothetical protein
MFFFDHNLSFFEPRTVGQSPPATSSYIKKSRETSTYNRPNQRLGEQKKAKSEKGKKKKDNQTRTPSK